MGVKSQLVDGAGFDLLL